MRFECQQFAQGSSSSNTGVSSGLSCAARILQRVSRNLYVTGHGPTPAKGRTMKRVFVGLATTVLASGGLGLAGLGAGTAEAACTPDTGGYACGYGPNLWCPGDSVYSDQGGPDNGVNWDMNVCHTWYRVAQGAGNVPVPERPGSNENSSTVWEGPNPPPPALPPPPAPPGLPPPPGMCWSMWIPGPCPGG
jgi:hypothetical protein